MNVAMGSLAAIALAMAAVPAAAQVRTIDPDQTSGMAATRAAPPPAETPAADYTVPESAPVAAPSAAPAAAPAAPPSAAAQASAAAADNTYQENDVLSAAEGVFGKGAEGLAKLIEDIFKKQGRPNAYIAGREVGGAFIAGLRYGSGTLFHKIEGQQPIYWTGPSVGFDLGANGSKTFVLVYNLYDTQDLYRRFPAAEGDVYVIGGFTASYLRRGDIVVIPIRLGVGWRLGANIGYMKFSHKSKWMPF